MTHTVRILAQYEENYADDFINVDYWKKKGGHEFTLEVSDAFRYLDEEVQVEFFKQVVAEGNTRGQRFTYIEHDYPCSGSKLEWKPEYDKMVEELYEYMS